MSDPLTTETYVRGLCLLIAAIFAATFLVLAGVDSLFPLLVFVVFLSLDTAIANDGWNRRLWNAIPGVDEWD